MGFKLGAVVGFGVGYYLGAKAGRSRYEQLNRWADNVKQTDTYEATTAKVRDMASEGVAIARARLNASDADDGPAVDDGPEPGPPFPAQDVSNN